MAPGWGAGLCCLFPLPFLWLPLLLLIPAGKGNPLLLPSPGARWELNVVFRFLYCGPSLPHIKNSSHGRWATVLRGSSQQLCLVSCAELTEALRAPSWVPGQKRVPVSLLAQPLLGDSEGGGPVLGGPRWPWYEMKRESHRAPLFSKATCNLTMDRQLPGLAVHLAGNQRSISSVPGSPKIQPGSSESLHWGGSRPQRTEEAIQGQATISDPKAKVFLPPDVQESPQRARRGHLIPHPPAQVGKLRP